MFTIDMRTSFKAKLFNDPTNLTEMVTAIAMDGMVPAHAFITHAITWCQAYVA